MRIRYFVVDTKHQLRRVSQALVEGAWAGRRDTRELAQLTGDDVRLITALCDEQLNPRIVFFMRMTLENGQITQASRELAYQTVTNLATLHEHTSTCEYHTTGWPEDWQQQLAVALDTPAQAFDRFAIGGPLPVSDLMGISIREVLRYFRDVAKD